MLNGTADRANNIVINNLSSGTNFVRNDAEAGKQTIDAIIRISDNRGIELGQTKTKFTN